MPLVERVQLADSIATAGEMVPTTIDGGLPLTGYLRRSSIPVNRLRIYIEGDGFAFVTSTSPSLDPTPIDPVALRLAAADPFEHVLYLARPCQFIDARANRCPERFWTTHRYSREVLELYHRALETLQSQFGVNEFDLIGYSGGGAIAALLAAERDDVSNLITIAANLDLDAFNRHHNAAAMPHSLNPADFAGSIANLPQFHLVGEDDRIVPASVVRSFLRQQKLPNEVEKARLLIVPNAQHSGPWSPAWLRILESTKPRWIWSTR